MKKVGKEVAFLHTGKGNPRSGEGSFVRLKDGRIMYAYTEYYGEDWADHATARISAIYSSDEGESFGEPVVLIEKKAHQMNIMSVSLVRMPNEEIGMLYLEKLDTGDGCVYCMPIFSYSNDEGKTFSEPIPCTTVPGYYICVNDRITLTKSGRILMALSHCGDFYNTVTYHIEPGHIRLLYSDDNGRSWDFLPPDIFLCYSEGLGLTEPGVIEFDDGTLWVYFRTPYGYQYQAFSHDGGNTFTGVEPNLYFTSPDSPMLVRQISRGTLAVFNPQGFNCMVDRLESWGSAKRTPFVLAVTTGDGRDFDNTRNVGKSAMHGYCRTFPKMCYLLEDDTAESYCYPALVEVADGILVAYYHSDGKGICLNSTKITKVRFEEIGL
jgi:hypothetical protein